MRRWVMSLQSGAFGARGGRSRRLHASVLGLGLVAMLASPVRAQDLDLKIVAVMKNVADEFGEFNDAKGAVQDAIAGRVPSVVVRFSDLAQKAKATADAIRNTPTPPFDRWDQYAVSLDDLRGCLTHDASMGKLKANSDTMAVQVADGTAKLAQLDAAITQAQALFADGQYVDQFYSKIVWIPAYNAAFIGDYMDVHNEVLPAFGGVVQALTDYRARYSAALEKAKLMSSNLAANTAAMAGFDPVVGSYAASALNGSVAYQPTPANSSKVALSGLNISVTIGSDRRVQTATITMTEADDVTVFGGFVLPTVRDGVTFAPSGGAAAPPNVSASFAGVPGGRPNYVAEFSGQLQNDCKAIQGTLTVRRQDPQSPALRWSLSIPTRLSR